MVEFEYRRWDSAEYAYCGFDTERPVSVGPVLGRALNSVLEGAGSRPWTSVSCLWSPVAGGVGTILAMRPDSSVGDCWSQFRAEPEHRDVAAVVELAAGGWETLRRTLNRARPELLREATEVWGVRPLPAADRA